MWCLGNQDDFTACNISSWKRHIQIVVKTNHTRNTHRLCNKVITLEFGMSKAVMDEDCSSVCTLRTPPNFWLNTTIK